MEHVSVLLMGLDKKNYGRISHDWVASCMSFPGSCSGIVSALPKCPVSIMKNNE